MPTHTPGPWNYRDNMISAQDGNGATLATVNHTSRDALNPDADGALMAAAPELKAALAALLRADELPPSAPAMERQLSAMAEARALLQSLNP